MSRAPLDATAGVRGPARRPPLAAMTGRPAWMALAVVVVALLAFGSVHGRAGPSGRVAYLESVIKCPSCADLTIAQSDSSSADELRALVTRWVREGRSNAWIEQQVVDHYGSAELLSPPASGLDAALWVVPVAAIAIGCSGLAWFLVRRRNALATARLDHAGSAADDEERVREALELGEWRGGASR